MCVVVNDLLAERCKWCFRSALSLVIRVFSFQSPFRQVFYHYQYVSALLLIHFIHLTKFLTMLTTHIKFIESIYHCFKSTRIVVKHEMPPFGYHVC